MTVNQLPNVLTCLNLLCGCVGIISVFHGNMVLLGSMIFLAALFDYMDGLTARTLNVHSELGKSLDSLADMVTFGVVPGMILYNLFLKQPEQSFLGSFTLFHIFKYFPFVYTVFAAYRLARFNTDPRQRNHFLGLPVPAAGILVTSFPLIVKFDTFHLAPLITNPYLVLLTSVLLAFLMVVELPLFNLKFATYRWQANRTRFSFLILSALLLVLLRFSAIPVIVALYIVFSVLHFYVFNKATA